MNSANLDDPITTISRKDIFRKKRFVFKIYQDWYHIVKENLWCGSNHNLELGSGAGFINDFIPNVITSDVLFLPFIDTVLNGTNLPFSADSIDNLVMVDVFHHIPDVDRFFTEGQRVLLEGGRIIMIEPWMNPWSKWIYLNLHHEIVDQAVKEWHFTTSGPLSGANQALPWIVFDRDRKVFEKKYPELEIKKIKLFMPFLYLLGGGFSNILSMPSFSYSFWKKIEKVFFNESKWGMFALIVLEKVK